VFGVVFGVGCRNLNVWCCVWFRVYGFVCLVLYLVSDVGICVFGVVFSVGCRNLNVRCDIWCCAKLWNLNVGCCVWCRV